MLNIPWCASMLVSILLSSIRPQQNWTASIATLWIANNKDKSRHTKISERWHCASTRTGIASNNGTLNSYSKNKHMLNMLRICLVINICEQILQSRIKSIHASPKEICADFLTPFWKKIQTKYLTWGTVNINLMKPPYAETRQNDSLSCWVHTCKRLWSIIQFSAIFSIPTKMASYQ